MPQLISYKVVLMNLKLLNYNKCDGLGTSLGKIAKFCKLGLENTHATS